MFIEVIELILIFSKNFISFELFFERIINLISECIFFVYLWN